MSDTPRDALPETVAEDDAAAASNEAEGVPGEAAEPAGGKRVRGPSLPAAQKGLAEAEKQLAKAEESFNKAKNATGYEKTKPARIKAIEDAQTRLAQKQAKLEEAKEKLHTAEAAEKDRREAEEAKRQRKLVDDNAGREWTAAGRTNVVQMRLDLEASFASKKTKNDSEWQNVLDLLRMKADRGDFPKSDLEGPGGIERVKRCWAKEEHEYRWYAREVQRYKVSGAPREDIDSIPRRCDFGIELATSNSRPRPLASHCSVRARAKGYDRAL